MSLEFDTRPLLTQREFEAALKRVRPSHWLTSEEYLLHRREVMEVDGWSSYGSPGNLQLTLPQRHLMMWSDIVGQTSNGGIDQFFENYAKTLDFAVETVKALEWRDLQQRFDEAFAQYICDRDGQPTSVARWLSDRESEQEEKRQEAQNYWQAKNGAPYEGDKDKLDILVQVLAFQGVITLQGWEYPEIDVFNKWFYSNETRQASEHFVGAFIIAHKDELVRIAPEAN